MIKRNIIFSRKRDLYLEFPPYFKIYKCPDEFPQPPFPMAHHPYFIEYEVEKVPPKKGLKSGARQIKKGNKYGEFEEDELSETSVQNEQNRHALAEYMVLLNVLTDNYVFTYGSRIHYGWAINLEDKQDKSSYSQAGYREPEYDRDVSELNFIEKHNIFDRLFNVQDSEGKVVRDVGLRNLIGIYKSIADQKLKRDFLNACIVFNKSQYLLDHEISASYMFMVTSLEALIGIKYRDVKTKNCRSCGQPRYKVGEKFRAFIDEYGYGVDKKTKKEFYDLRSGISHRGQLLEPSYDLSFFITNQEDLDKEYLRHKHSDTHSQIQKLTQVCFSKFLFSLK